MKIKSVLLVCVFLTACSSGQAPTESPTEPCPCQSASSDAASAAESNQNTATDTSPDADVITAEAAAPDVAPESKSDSASAAESGQDAVDEMTPDASPDADVVAAEATAPDVAPESSSDSAATMISHCAVVDKIDLGASLPAISIASAGGTFAVGLCDGEKCEVRIVVPGDEKIRNVRIVGAKPAPQVKVFNDGAAGFILEYQGEYGVDFALMDSAGTIRALHARTHNFGDLAKVPDGFVVNTSSVTAYEGDWVQEATLRIFKNDGNIKDIRVASAIILDETLEKDFAMNAVSGIAAIGDDIAMAATVTDAKSNGAVKAVITPATNGETIEVIADSWTGKGDRSRYSYAWGMIENSRRFALGYTIVKGEMFSHKAITMSPGGANAVEYELPGRPIAFIGGLIVSVNANMSGGLSARVSMEDEISKSKHAAVEQGRLRQIVGDFEIETGPTSPQSAIAVLSATRFAVGYAVEDGVQHRAKVAVIECSK